MLSITGTRIKPSSILISITTSVFGVAPYSKDRLELSSVATILGEVVRLAVLFVSYFFFRPYLWYVGCASVAKTPAMVPIRFEITVGT